MTTDLVERCRHQGAHGSRRWRAAVSAAAVLAAASVGCSGRAAPVTVASTVTSAPPTPPTTATTPTATASAAPGYHLEPIPTSNRRYPTFEGGWGPLLRPLLRDRGGDLWFVVDKGPDVQHDEQLVYHRNHGGSWQVVETLDQLPGVQQNVASILVGDEIDSFGVITGGGDTWGIEQCVRPTALDGAGRCSALVTADGTPLTLPSASNYIGAAVLPGGRRVVWWSEVGSATRPGVFGYTVEDGSGWSSAVRTPLAPYNSIGYVAAVAVGADELVVGAEVLLGDYPGGELIGVLGRITLGGPLRDVTPLETRPGERSEAVEDVWLDRPSGVLHVASHDIGATRVTTFAVPVDAWSPSNAPRATALFEHTFRARFAQDGDRFHLLLGSDENQVSPPIRDLAAPAAAAGTVVRWNDVAPDVVAVPEGPGYDYPSAIYLESPSSQTAPAQYSGFAFTGAAGGADDALWYARRG